MNTTIMIIPNPINWEAIVWETRYYKAISIINQLLMNSAGNAIWFGYDKQLKK